MWAWAFCGCTGRFVLTAHARGVLDLCAVVGSICRLCIGQQACFAPAVTWGHLLHGNTLIIPKVHPDDIVWMSSFFTCRFCVALQSASPSDFSWADRHLFLVRLCRAKDRRNEAPLHTLF
jgi:hypothetical protein